MGRRRRVRLVTEPPSQRRVAAVSLGDGWLHAALGAAGRTPQPYVKMIVMPPPGADFSDPGRATRLERAELSLDRGVDEDSLDGRIFGGKREKAGDLRRPRPGEAMSG